MGTTPPPFVFGQPATVEGTPPPPPDEEDLSEPFTLSQIMIYEEIELGRATLYPRTLTNDPEVTQGDINHLFRSF